MSCVLLDLGVNVVHHNVSVHVITSAQEGKVLVSYAAFVEPVLNDLHVVLV